MSYTANDMLRCFIFRYQNEFRRPFARSQAPFFLWTLRGEVGDDQRPEHSLQTTRAQQQAHASSTSLELVVWRGWFPIQRMQLYAVCRKNTHESVQVYRICIYDILVCRHMTIFTGKTLKLISGSFCEHQPGPIRVSFEQAMENVRPRYVSKTNNNLDCSPYQR